MSYLIVKNACVAETSIALKSGAIVRVAHDSSVESIDANREENLVNAFYARVSNAKKWAIKSGDWNQRYLAVAINNGAEEFLLKA
jgi:hypothetical protein